MGEESGIIYRGQCMCGRVSYICSHSPIWSGVCHCDACKKASGGPFAVFVSFSIIHHQWTGAPPSTYRSSAYANRFFCNECGNPLGMIYDDDEEISVTWASLSETCRMRPEFQIFHENANAWALHVDTLEQQAFECSLTPGQRLRLNALHN